MRVRSLPHFSHKPIGKTTHKKGMAYAHVNYITREEACSKTLADNMPETRDGARPYFDHTAYKEGVAANARVADTFIIALPIELSREQRHEAIARFMDKIGHGRIAWLAAFHDMGKDEHNPHCHLILRDADVETGRKVVGTTTSAKDVKEAIEHGWRVPPRMTTKDLRVAWCDHLNGEMERHGIDVRFDQRRLKEQGIDREPQIHVGPKAAAMAEKGKTFESEDRRRGDHANVYSLFDTGSRAEHNQRIIEANRQRAAGGPAPSLGREGQEKQALRVTQAAERKAMYQEQTQDRAALRDRHDGQKIEHGTWGRGLYAQARETAFQEVKLRTAERWKQVHAIKSEDSREEAARALKAEQKSIYAETSAKHVQLVRPVKDEAWKTMKLTQDKDRLELKQRHGEEAAALSRQHMAERQALHEKWQAQHADKQAQRISARLENRQGMVAVQTTAMALAKLHHHAERRSSGGNPAEASRLFGERARAEQTKHSAIRYELNAERQLNLGHGASRREQRHGLSANADQRAKDTPQADETGRSRRQESLFATFAQQSNKGRDGGRSGR